MCSAVSSWPAQQFERGPREHFEGHHGGGRVARQPEEELAARPPEYQRLAGLNQHAVEKEFRAEARQHALDDVVLARRDAAGKQQQVGVQGPIRSILACAIRLSRATGRIHGTPPARATCAASE